MFVVTKPGGLSGHVSSAEDAGEGRAGRPRPGQLTLEASEVEQQRRSDRDLGRDQCRGRRRGRGRSTASHQETKGHQTELGGR